MFFEAVLGVCSFILDIFSFEMLYRCFLYYSESQCAKKTFTARIPLVGPLCNILHYYGYISQYLKERKTFPWNFLQISWYYCVKCGESHCVISVLIQIYSGLCFFFRICTEYGEMLRISPYSVRLQENADQNNSVYRHFLRSVCLCFD